MAAVLLFWNTNLAAVLLFWSRVVSEGKFQSDLRRFILPVSNVSCLARLAQNAIHCLRSMQALESNGRKISGHASRFFTQP